MQKTERDSKQESPDDFVLVRRVDASGRFGSLPASAAVQAKSERDETSRLVGIPPTPVSLRESKEASVARGMKGSFTRGKGMQAALTLPPRIQLSPSLSHVYRFRSTNANAANITVANILGALGGICTVVNSKITTWSGSFKILKVTVWPSASASAPTVATLDWQSGQSGQVPDQSLDEAIPEGISVTKGLSFTPPAKSLCGDWINSSDASAILLSLATSVGSIVDFHVVYRLTNVFGGVQETVVSAVLGVVYYLALDGPSSNTYQPIGLLTTS
jgi:hypothetical protein